MSKSAVTGNGFDPKLTKKFVDQILGKYSDLDSMKGKFMQECKGVQDAIGDVYDRAKDAGIPKRALKGVIKTKLLELKIEAIREGLADDDAESAESYDMIRHALGDLADTPLGKAATDRAGKMDDAVDPMSGADDDGGGDAAVH